MMVGEKDVGVNKCKKVDLLIMFNEGINILKYNLVFYLISKVINGSYINEWGVEE